VNGEVLFASGTFDSIGGVSADHLAVWDGISWAVPGSNPPFNAGLNDFVTYTNGGSSGDVLVGAGETSIPSTDVVTWGGCDCVADTNDDGVLDNFDVQLYLGWFSGADSRADMNCDGVFEFADVKTYLGLFSAGCAF